MFEQISENIKLLRKRKKISQNDLGLLLKITRQQVSHYETGDTTIPLASVAKMSKIFKISIDSLVWLDLPKYTETELNSLLENELNFVNNIHGIGNKNSKLLLDEYVTSIVKDNLQPVEDLLKKVMIKIEMTDLKYDLGAEIQKVNTSLEMNKESKK